MSDCNLGTVTMGTNGDNRSVNVGGNLTGAQIVTGDNNTLSMQGVKVALPPAAEVDPARELAALRALLTKLQATDHEALQEALGAAEKEAAKPEPDKAWIAAALERALGIAKTANGFGEQAEALAPRIAALASWLGKMGAGILSLVGLAG